MTATIPTTCAVPGLMVPGLTWPGEPITAATTGTGFYKFSGYEVLTYPEYTDLATGVDLVASPGGMYQIMNPTGHADVHLPRYPLDGFWVPA